MIKSYVLCMISLVMMFISSVSKMVGRVVVMIFLIFFFVFLVVVVILVIDLGSVVVLILSLRLVLFCEIFIMGK